MRKALRTILVAAVVAGAYATTPLIAALQISEAVRTGDVQTLQTKVDWPSVRQALKSSLAETRQVITELTDAAGLPRPGFWQRIKMAAMPFLTDPLIDKYVTAEAAPKLYAWRQTWRKQVKPNLGFSDKPTLLAGTWLEGTTVDRGLAFASRVQAVRFTSPLRVEIEVADRYRPARRWLATLRLVDFGWRLTEVHILHAPGRSAPRTVDDASAGSA